MFEVFSIAFLIFVVIFILRGIIVVRQAEVIVIERLGSYNRTLSNGLNFIIPIFETPRTVVWKYVKASLDNQSVYQTKNVTRIDLRETVYDFPKQNVITKDNVTIEINALLYFQITDPKKIAYEINNLPDAIEKLTQTTLRNVIGELDLDETLVSRDTINSKLRLILDEATDKWGVKVNRVELQDIIPPKEIRTAMEKQMKAERDKRASILTAEGAKKAKILNAEGERDSQIARAEGIKRSNILKAEGEAEARLKVASAEAKTINMITDSIDIEKTDSVNYLVALKYIEALKNISEGSNDKVVFMPYETSGLLSSLGSIKELFDNSKK
ncbi:SPFH domain-containing protein [Haliovirga abyssi]|uniref:Peptidase n=1 Tax=Haliovirga abyssi TaxID=2996794 RepID=A0AAU9DA97_9FUSO|nr:SPFH domain-containing protein [Haliovirga abyssi]BDU50260.1 peptidase [Haliovirga abyssi]